MASAATTRPQRRAPGRPAGGCGDPRARLLDAAALLVGRHGVAGTSLSAVARRARVTPAMVNYYFGGKGRLLDALFAERIAPVFERIGARVAAALSGGGAPLPIVVETYVGELAAAPWLPPLMAREVLSEGGALRERFLALARPVVSRVPRAVRGAQAAGRLRADLDPRLLVLSIVSAVVWPMIAAPIWRDLLVAPEPEVDTRALSAHIASVLSRGLEVHHAAP